MDLNAGHYILMYLAVGSMVGLAFHLQTQEAIRKYQRGREELCSYTQDLGRIGVNLYSLPEVMVPAMATVKLGVVMLLWPPVLISVLHLALHQCGEKCTSSDTDN